MNQSLLSQFGDPRERVEKALAALRVGEGVLVPLDRNAAAAKYAWTGVTIGG